MEGKLINFSVNDSRVKMISSSDPNLQKLITLIGEIKIPIRENYFK